MRKNSIIISILTLIVLLFAGCSKDHISNKQIILFQYDYFNNSGDPGHNGFLIDSKGNVMIYQNPEDWNDQEELTEEQVIENLQKCQLSPIKIQPEDLAKHKKYIINIASSKVSARRQASVDEGTARFVCYEYSESSRTYKGYLIKMEGDYTCENLNFYSKMVSSWMRDIGIEIGNAIVIETHRW